MFYTHQQSTYSVYIFSIYKVIWMKTNDTLEIFNEETYLADVKEEVAMCISHKKIHYPLPENLRLIHTAYEAGD